MKQLIVVAVLAALVPSAAAIANYSGPTGNGTAHIMSGSSASTSTGVTEGEDGSRVLWEAEVAQIGTACASENATGLREVNWTSEARNGTAGPARYWRTVTFTGRMRAPDPCHTVDHDVLDRGNGTFVLNVSTVAANGTCVQCVGAVTYTAAFGAPGDYSLTVMHDGRLVEVLEPPGNGGNVVRKNGVLAALVEFLAGLFGF